MSCNNCGKKFSLLCRDHGCKKCGFAFCSNCLKFKLSFPDPNGKASDKNVCGACSKKAYQPDPSPMNRAPPDALLKRLESLEAPNSNPITVYSTKMDRLKKGLSKEDAAIADRLQKLQGDRKISQNLTAPTNDEIAERLAKLKGESEVKHVEVPQGSHKSDVERASNLICQLQDQVELERRLPSAEDEISERLARLRGIPFDRQLQAKKDDIDPEIFLQSKSFFPEGIGNTPLDVLSLLEEVSREVEEDAQKGLKDIQIDKDLQKHLKEIRKNKKGKLDESDDEEDVKELTDRVLSEAKLDRIEDSDDDDLQASIPDPPSKSLLRQLKLALKASDSSHEDKDEELPWCIICNENACLRCHGCDGDLFCYRCFRECHQKADVDLRDHKTSPYEQPGTPEK